MLNTLLVISRVNKTNNYGANVKVELSNFISYHKPWPTSPAKIESHNDPSYEQEMT
jgi:hypothetical protein